LHEHDLSFNRAIPSALSFLSTFPLLSVHSHLQKAFVVAFTYLRSRVASLLCCQLMEHWHTKASVPYQGLTSELPSRVLASSTGNIQSYALDSNDGIENQNPYLPAPPVVKPELRLESQYSGARFKLDDSAHHHTENLARLNARREQNREKYGEKYNRRRRLDPARPYLQDQKYLQYRARPRCDTGPDGKPVWPDHVEEAFQNGQYIFNLRYNRL
jgi:hypothetical protein